MLGGRASKLGEFVYSCRQEWVCWKLKLSSSWRDVSVSYQRYTISGEITNPAQYQATDGLTIFLRLHVLIWTSFLGSFYEVISIVKTTRGHCESWILQTQDLGGALHNNKLIFRIMFHWYPLFVYCSSTALPLFILHSLFMGMLLAVLFPFLASIKTWLWRQSRRTLCPGCGQAQAPLHLELAIHRLPGSDGFVSSVSLCWGI